MRTKSFEMEKNLRKELKEMREKFDELQLVVDINS
jgi:hypothetical protein